MNELVAVTPDDPIFESLVAGDLNLSEELLAWKNSKFYNLAISELFKAAVRVPKNYIDHENLTIFNDSGDLEHDIGINPAEARDDTDVFTFQPTEIIVKQIDAAWAEGTNAGGMDTGAVAANSVYYLFYIYKPATNHVDAIFSLTKAGPLMPAGYTLKVRIMTVLTDAAANIYGFKQTADRVMYTTRKADRALATLANTNRNAFAITAPPLMDAIVNVEGFNSTSSADVYLWIGDSNYADAAASASNRSIHLYDTSAPNNVETEVLLDASRQLYIRGSSTNIRMSIITLGWIDDRGRNV